MAAPCYLCDCCHGAFECSTWFGDHGVMAQMKVQCLYNVCRMFTSTCIKDVRDIGLGEKKKWEKHLVRVIGFFISSAQVSTMNNY